MKNEERQILAKIARALLKTGIGTSLYAPPGSTRLSGNRREICHFCRKSAPRTCLEDYKKYEIKHKSGCVMKLAQEFLRE